MLIWSLKYKGKLMVCESIMIKIYDLFRFIDHELSQFTKELSDYISFKDILRMCCFAKTADKLNLKHVYEEHCFLIATRHMYNDVLLFNM